MPPNVVRPCISDRLRGSFGVWMGVVSFVTEVQVEIDLLGTDVLQGRFRVRKRVER